jgi:hypothetical protein
MQTISSHNFLFPSFTFSFTACSCERERVELHMAQPKPTVINPAHHYYELVVLKVIHLQKDMDHNQLGVPTKKSAPIPLTTVRLSV